MSAVLSQARARLVARLSDRIENGAVRDICASRALESALMLSLLRDTGTHPRSQEKLVRYLRRHPAPLGSFDRLLITAALDGATVQDRSPDALLSWLSHFDHFSSPRKRLLLCAVLAILTKTPLDHDPHEINYGDFAPWVNLSLCAIKLLHLVERGQEAHRELAFMQDLLSHGSTEPVFERHVLSHLLALIALNRTARCHALVRDGVTSLLACQNSDGGMPFIDGFEIFCTATAGLALIATPETPPVLTTELADYLASQQQPGGGWAYAEGVRQCDVDDTAYCVQYLTRTSADRYADQITAGREYLISLINSDGGFPTFLKGHPSEIAMTAGAISALGPHDENRKSAIEYLLAGQKPSGNFECSWSLSESNAVFRVLESLNGGHPRTATLAAGYLLTTQNNDGGWGQHPTDPSDVISTSYAILALKTWRSTPSYQAGIDYLLAQEQPNGGFISLPDQAAPRPLPYDVPVLADICALWALGTYDRTDAQRGSHTEGLNRSESIDRLE